MDKWYFKVTGFLTLPIVVCVIIGFITIGKWIISLF